MSDLLATLSAAFNLIAHLNHELLDVILLSFEVSLGTTLVSCLIGLPIGATVAVARFPGRSLLIAVMNASQGIPTVVVGLVVYLLLSRTGPFGDWGLLFTPTAMVIAQTIVVTPVIAALSRQTIEDLHQTYDEQLQSFDVGRMRAALTLMWDGRFSLLTAVLAGLGRAIEEVGAIIVVGGNIRHYTRVMTTSIALETSRGELPLALALGIILVGLAYGINIMVQLLRDAAYRRYG